MTSGKQSKRKRRAAQAPPPPVRRKGERRQASPKVLVAVGALLALVVLGVVLGVFLGGRHSKSNVPNEGSLVGALPGAADVQRQLAGIPQRGNVLGKPSAPVTMIQYIDLQCPFCRAFETEAMPTLISRYVRTGKLKVQSRVIGFIGPDSQRGRAAALAAGRQNKLFNFAQLLYFNQGIENTGWLDDSMIQAAAASVPGLLVRQLLDERKSSSVSDEAHAVDAQAAADRVLRTPTFVVGRTGRQGKEILLADPANAQPLVKAIRAALGS